MSQRNEKRNNITNDYFIAEKVYKLNSQNAKKIEIMFKTYFLSLSTVLTKNIKTFFYFTLTSDASREIMKTVYKVELNKALKINKITNRILQQFVDVATKQLQSFFNKCIQENI